MSAPTALESSPTVGGLEAEAASTLELFVDTLCHFAGEQPAIDALQAWMSEDASVVEVGEEDCGRTEWLSRVARRAAARSAGELGHFVVIHDLELIALDDRIACAVLGVTVRDTSESSVVRSGTARIEVVLRRVGRRLSITRLMIGPADTAV